MPKRTDIKSILIVAAFGLSACSDGVDLSEDQLSDISRTCGLTDPQILKPTAMRNNIMVDLRVPDSGKLDCVEAEIDKMESRAGISLGNRGMQEKLGIDISDDEMLGIMDRVWAGKQLDESDLAALGPDVVNKVEQFCGDPSEDLAKTNFCGNFKF